MPAPTDPGYLDALGKALLYDVHKNSGGRPVLLTLLPTDATWNAP